MALDRWLTVVSVSSAAALGGQQAAFLVDADNFSDALALESAWAQVQARAGRVSVCRAYGAPTRLQSLAAVWRSLGARTFPNLALDKNTTDAALIADAVALHFQQGVRLFAIASGDADFAPLAVRLREWGCEVWCFSMNGILFAGAEVYYDRVVRFAPSPVASVEPVATPAAPVKKVPAPAAVVLEVEKPLPPVVTAATAAVVATAPNAPVPLPIAAVGPAPLLPVLPVLPVLVVPVVPKPKSVPSPRPPSAQPVVLPDMVKRILQALPALREEAQMLSQVVPVLRQKSILGKTTKSTAFFASYSAYFKLSPTDKPTHLAYVPPRRIVQPVAPIKPIAVMPLPIGMGRRAARPLLAELHGLRSVLVQMAMHRVTIADVLLAVPELLRGQPCVLGTVAVRLREKGLLRSSQSALRILERHPGAFEVDISCVPLTVLYLR